MTYPIPGLNKRQREVFESIATGGEGPYHPKTLAKLLAVGAIVERQRTIGRDAFGLVVVSNYSVPLPLHYAWCRWCADEQEVAP